MKWKRWLLIITLLPVYVGLLVVAESILLGLIADPPIISTSLLSWLGHLLDLLTDVEWLGVTSLIAVGIAVTQAAFLFPVIRMRPPQGERPRSLFFSFAIVALIASGICTAMITGLMELGSSVFTGAYADSPWDLLYEYGSDMADSTWLMLSMLILFLAGWGIWSFILFVFTRQMWADKILGRLVGLLIGGTVIELIIITPIDVMVRRRTDCYCATGTFFSLLISSVAILWLAGPGIYFALTAKHRRTWRKQYCGQCGQRKGPTPGERCPECGYEW